MSEHPSEPLDDEAREALKRKRKARDEAKAEPVDIEDDGPTDTGVLYEPPA